MDEIIFRGSQKAESIQLQAELLASKAKDIFIVYVQQGKLIFQQVWSSATVEQVKIKLSENILRSVDVIRSVKTKIMEYANPKEMYMALLNILGKKWTKRDLVIGCTGLIVGGVIGFSIGVVIKKPQPIQRYMQAIQFSKSTQYVNVVEDAIAPYECGDNEVLVNVKAASVHLVDIQICSGYGRTLRNILQNIHKQQNSLCSIILGRDCTGVITDIGSRVKRLDIGDEVWVTVPFWSQGTMCQTIVVPESRVTRKPKNIGFESACSLPYAGSLALSALNEAHLDSSNAHKKKVLVQSACTPVACVLIQLLSHWNAEITATCYQRAVPVAKALGASDIIVLDNPSEQKTTDQSTKISLLKELALRDNIYDVIIETGVDFELGAEELSKFLKTEGFVISTLPPPLTSDNCGIFGRLLLSLYICLKYKLQNILGFPANDFDETHLCYVTLDRLTQFVEDGFVQTVVDKVYQPHDIDLAMNHVQSPQSIGSTVITFR